MLAGSLPTCVAPNRTVAAPRDASFGEFTPLPLVMLQPPLNLPLAPTGERDPGKLSALQMVFFFFSRSVFFRERDDASQRDRRRLSFSTLRSQQRQERNWRPSNAVMCDDRSTP